MKHKKVKYLFDYETKYPILNKKSFHIPEVFLKSGSEVGGGSFVRLNGQNTLF
jgi:hypothetical protein